MKIKLLSVALVSVLTMVGCQSTNDEQGINDRNNKTIDQVRNDDRDNMYDQVRNNTRSDQVLDRNNRMSETNQERGVDQDRHGMNDRNQNDQYDVSKVAADKITKEIKEIKDAYVLTMGNHAYVAAVLDNNNQDKINNNESMNRNRSDDMSNNKDMTGDELTDDVKKKIKDVVQSVEGNIENVYVTTNPDFADLTNNYMTDMNNGKPIRGFFDQIGNMIERVFPQNKNK